MFEGLRKRAAMRLVKVAEALTGSLLGSPGRSGEDEPGDLKGYRRLGEGSRLRDLDSISEDEMIRGTLNLYSSKGLAEWLVDTVIDLCIGQELGFNVEIDAEAAEMDPAAARELSGKIREDLEKFWCHPRHNIEEKAPEYGRTFLVTAHLVFPIAAVNAVDGVPQLDMIDAGQIRSVLPIRGSSIVPGLVVFGDPHDVAKHRALLIVQRDVDGNLRPMASTQLAAPVGDSAAAFDPVMALRAAADKVLDVPKDVEVVGECLYFRNNKLANSMRGVSYLLTVADWILALDDFVWTSLDRAKLRNKIVWHLQKQGYTQDQLRATVEPLLAAMAQPGGVFTSNEQATLEAKGASLETADNVELGRMILMQVLGAKGIPESWFSQGGNANRSTAAEQTDVAYKALLALQTRLGRIFRTMLHLAYDSLTARQGQSAAGKYPKRLESPWLRIEPALPPIQERDLSRVSAGLAQLATGMDVLVQGGLLSEQTAQKAIVSVVSKLTGDSIELDKEQERIAGDQQKRDDKAAEVANSMASKALDSLDPEGNPKPPAPKPPTPADKAAA